jgi:hypothetical protein
MKCEWSSLFSAVGAMTYLSGFLAILLIVAGSVSFFRPLMFCVSDDDHRFPFLADEDSSPSELADMNEPAGRQGRYPNAYYDCGCLSWAIYFRKNMYIPTQFVHPATHPDGALPYNGDWTEDIDSTPFEPFDNRLPWGIEYFRVWHQGATSLVFKTPLWMPIAFLSALPIWRICRWKRKRPQPGFCPKCGYDLRASPDRCPECGCKINPLQQPTLSNTI